MLKKIFNFFFQPYANVWYCVVYQTKWTQDQTFIRTLIAAVKDAWSNSSNAHLLGMR